MLAKTPYRPQSSRKNGAKVAMGTCDARWCRQTDWEKTVFHL